jgi:diguanylate cyclase (GGDEF)-like protein
MDRIQKKRLAIFSLIFIFTVFLVIPGIDLFVKITVAILQLLLVGFVVFLRETFRFESEGISEETKYSEAPPNPTIEPDMDESFEIISQHKVVEPKTYDITKHVQGARQTLKPPDLKERFEEIANEVIPENIDHGGQFSFVLEKILSVIKEAYDANTAIYFWYDRKKEKLSIESFVSNSNEIDKRKFDLEDDILSKIVQKAEPELLSEIASVAEVDVIRYYRSNQGIKSFVGVPLFFGKSLIAILAVDSKMPDAFGIETIYSLGRFVRLITMMISLFEDKYSEKIAQQRLNSLLQIITPDRKYDSDEDITMSIKNAVSSLVQYDVFTFIYFDPVSQKFKTEYVENKTSLKYVGKSLEIDFDLSMVGKSIKTGMPIKIDDTSANQLTRFAKVEDITFDGSFLCLPIVFNGQNYGVLCFESLKKHAYSNSDVQFLKNAILLLGFIVYSYSTQKLYKNLISIDVETRLLNAVTFRDRLELDLIRASQLKLHSALALIKIDDFLEQESLFDENPFPTVLKTIAQVIDSEIEPGSTLGRLDDRVFGVYFFNTSSKDVALWADKIRVKVARKPIDVVSKQTTYTVSIGVASAQGVSDVDELIHNAELALKKAVEKGGNIVRNIN